MKFKLLICLLFASLPVFAGLQRLSLSDAIRMNVVKAEGVAKGGYTGQALKLKLTNNTGNPLLITVDPAVVFRPADTTQQDLVLAGNEKISIAPFKEAAADVQTFCAKSHASSPLKNEPFSFLKKGSDTLEKVLLYLRQNNLLNSSLAQAAVWVITNDHGLDGVYAIGLERQSQQLVGFLSSLTGKAFPSVFRIYEHRNTPDVPVFNPKALSIIASFEEKLDAPKKLTLGVYDGNGALIQPVFEDRTFGKGGHRFKVDFEAEDVAPGAYFIRLKEGETVMQEKRVVVE